MVDLSTGTVQYSTVSLSHDWDFTLEWCDLNEPTVFRIVKQVLLK